MEHPAVGAFAVPDAPPIVGFGDDLDGKSGPAEHPDDGLIGARTFAHIDPVGFQADETRYGQAGLAARARGRACIIGGAGLDAGKDEERQRDPHHQTDPMPMPHRHSPALGTLVSTRVRCRSPRESLKHCDGAEK